MHSCWLCGAPDSRVSLKCIPPHALFPPGLGIFGPAIHDPAEDAHCPKPKKLQELPNCPPELKVLQWPKTASSGRRLTVVSCGDSYVFLPSARFGARSIQPPVAPPSEHSMIPTAPAAADRYARIIQNRKDGLGTHPTFHIDFSGPDALRRIHNVVVATAPHAEFTIPVCWNLDSGRRRPEMGDVAKKLDGALFITIFHFAIGRAHAAERTDATLDAFRFLVALASAHLAQRILPRRSEAGAPNVEGILLRDNADAHLSIGIDSERIHPPAAGIDCIDFRERGRSLKVALR